MMTWAIYHRPKFSSYPYAAREYTPEGHTGKVLEDISLEGLRGQIPAGFKMTFQSALVDPLVIEMWTRLD
ncbi:MAG TPA: hypothetical protein PLN91_01005 [Rhodanobacteraceae bacterium]|nr:hypothetical protein [Rhodanobacteraceae bacterium]